VRRSDEEVFREKISGAKTDRPELAKLIGRLESGDVLVVIRLDRLARSTRDLLKVLDESGKRGAGFKTMADVARTCAAVAATIGGLGGASPLGQGGVGAPG